MSNKNSMDLSALLDVDPNQLTEDEKDSICQTLVRADFGRFTDVHKLNTALKLLQVLLSFKEEQVVTLGLELDELASKQGEGEAQLIQEIEDLRAQLSKSPREHIQNGVDTEDDLRQLLHESELNAQRLLAEVQMQEQEQMSNKMEMEKLESQLVVLENDRLHLKGELSALREEIQDQQKEVKSDTQEPQKKNQQLVESLQQKNKHLSSLLNDVEASEKENIILREKLTNIKIELAEATKNIMHTTGEIVTLQITKEEQEERLRYLDQMCEALGHQVKELVEEKEKRDMELETFHCEINVRIDEWKKIVAMKEKEISDLHEQLAHQSLKGQYIMKNCESDQIALLSHALQKRESQVDELQAQLSQATKDLNETTTLLENVHRTSELSQTGPCIQDKEMSQKRIVAAEERIRILEEKLKDAENDADGKSEEITKMIIQLRSYEVGEFGLTEALAQVKDLSQQQAVRDKHIEQLVETANQLRGACDCLEEENLTLREQLNISPEVHIKTSPKVLKSIDKNIFEVQQQRINRLEEDLICARMDRRNLSQQVLALSKQLQELEMHPQGIHKPSSKSQNRSQADARATARKIRTLQQKQHQSSIERQTLIEENEALRQGLHDILDSVHSQDGKSKVRLESKVLEHLLHALDSRHISGWYHPAMRIQAKVNAIEGNNEALREQLHSMREEESQTLNELQKAKHRIAELEENSRETTVISETDGAKCAADTNAEFSKLSATLNLSSEISSQGLDVIAKMNKHLLCVLHELEVDKSQVAETLNIQRELQIQLEELVAQLVQAVNQHNAEKEKWQGERSHLEGQNDMIVTKLAASDTKVAQLTSLWDAFSSKDEVNKDVVADVFNFAALTAEKDQYKRIAEAMQRQAHNSKTHVQIIRSEWNASKQWTIKQLGDLLQFKRNSLCRLSELESVLVNSVPIASLKAANKQADEMAAKYYELLRQHEISVNVAERELNQLMSELELEREMKHDVAKQLVEVSKKLWTRNSNNDICVQELVGRLADAEGEILRQKQQASYAGKMCKIIKEEITQVSERCVSLEEEVMALLRMNQQQKLELSSIQSSVTGLQIADKDDVEDQLAAARAEVFELQASQKHLQELANISAAQVQMLDQLHERSELQLDSLRQVMYKLQSESDLGSEITRLSEELCASQISEMAAWNRTAGLEKELGEVLSLSEKQAREIEELQDKINLETQKTFQLNRKMQEKMVTSHECSESSLPLSFFHLLVTAYVDRSADCRDLWHRLQEAKQELASLTLNAEEKRLSCQQTIELQNALKAIHSDLECQRIMESWAADLTQLKIKDLKNSRQCEVMEANLKQAQERLQNQESLLSSIEQQLLTLDVMRTLTSPGKERTGAYSEDIGKVAVNDRLMQMQQSAGYVDPIFESKHIRSAPSPEKSLQPEPQTKVDEQQNNEVLLQEQLLSLREEITKLTVTLESSKSEVESYRKMCSDLQRSLHEKETLHQGNMVQELPVSTDLSKKDKQSTSVYDKIALQSTVESLQNIINQKEDTISRYQKFLRDVREEDSKIISALQEHLRAQQAELTVQEQAYVRLKISMRHLTLEANEDPSSKVSLDEQLIRSNELEDEVALLNAKIASLSSEVLNKEQEASHWSSIAQQHLSTIEELNIRILEHKSSEKRPLFSMPYHDTLVLNSSKDNNLLASRKSEQEMKEKIQVSKTNDGLPKVKANQIQVQSSVELTDLKNKVLQMEEQERQHKNEIQRLRDQIPIYSRRIQQSQNGSVLPERESELLKKIKYLEQQLEQQTEDHEKIIAQRNLQEAKKMKSVENVARWDERKKHQIQIERLKRSLQEQTDEVALLHAKLQRMHNTVHRLEREKIALEHQKRNLRHIQQDNAVLEERVKNLERYATAQCMLEELQQERDKLYAEVQMLRAKDASRVHGYKEEYASDSVQKERSDLLKANLELECENLELKLELEKIRPEALCLRHKVNHVERCLVETYELRSGEDPSGGMLDATMLQENKSLMQKVQQLSQQLEAANHCLRALENQNDHDKIAVLQAELNQKCSLLVKVKTLLERAAVKERQLTEQVHKLEAMIAKK